MLNFDCHNFQPPGNKFQHMQEFSRWGKIATLTLFARPPSNPTSLLKEKRVCICTEAVLLGQPNHVLTNQPNFLGSVTSEAQTGLAFLWLAPNVAERPTPTIPEVTRGSKRRGSPPGSLEPGATFSRGRRSLPTDKPQGTGESQPLEQTPPFTHPGGKVSRGDGEFHRPLLVLQEGESPAQAGALSASVPLHPEEA